MRFRTKAWCLAAAALAAAPIALLGQQQNQGQQPPPTFRAGTKVVALYTTVTDGNGRLVPGLGKEDFEVLDDDKPQSVSVFSSENEPITVVVMLDTSGSMTNNIDLVKAGAEQFFLRLLPRDRGQVGDFNDKIQLLSGVTGDRDELVSALRDVDFGYPTRLWDAVEAGLDSLKGLEGRRVVLVFTDGGDTSSKVSFGRMLERARTEEVMVYAIGLQGEEPGPNGRVVRTRPDRSLRKLADETGGGYFELDQRDQLTSTFTRVSEELHSQYVIGFSPETRDGKVHRLEVRVKRPGMKARARKSYVAS
ncbi:MAG: VWA domain-containing protein [Bacteroidales bacterium]